MAKTKQVPTKAFELAGGAVTLGSNGEDAKTAPFKMTARQAGPIDHWYWGRIVHDFDGMRFGANGKGRIAIDYNHDSSQIIGFANKFDTSGDLELSGALVPYAADPTDKATEVLTKWTAGVPYESSIFFEADEIEELAEGQSTRVNNQDFSGPGVVVRSWTLRGCAVCPHGADPGTNTAFSESDTKTVRVKKMKNELTAAVVEDETQDAQEVADVATVDGADVDDSAESAQSEVAEVATVEDTVADVEAQSPVEMSEGKRFLEAFGDQGGVWFAQGMSFADAQAKYLKSMRDENADLRSKLSALQALSGDGEETPASFNASDKPTKTKLSDTYK